MISGWGLLLVSLAYVGGLFLVAWWGDRSRFYPNNTQYRALIYSLALAVYCSSWTFYGAVGTAARTGLSYLPIYLGPMLLFLFGLPFFERMARIAKQRNATSISDLLSARFGRSQHIAVIVSIVALTAAIPYLALQLKAISMSIEVLSSPGHIGTSLTWYNDATFIVAMMLALFASLFGTREVDATEHHPGMVLAIAAESVIKLLALLLVGVFALFVIDDWQIVSNTAREFPEKVGQPTAFLTQTLLSLLAIFCLPRQFQIGVVECADVSDMRKARWWFPAYLGLISIVVLPIVAAVLSIDPATRANVNPDAFVLWLPLSGGQEWLALLAYLGGFSAATGMVIVASVALATMVSNDLVLPTLWRLGIVTLNDRTAASGFILWIRRVAIFSILLGAYAFFRAVPTAPSLASMGLLAFAAVAQFAPAVFVCVYWAGASRQGVIGGLITGFLLWIYTLLLPALVSTRGEAPPWITEGPFGLSVLAPHGLLGIHTADTLTHGVLWSLVVNTAVLIGISLRHPPAIRERLQAASDLLDQEFSAARSSKLLPGSATIGDLSELAERLLGTQAAQRLLERHSQEQGRELLPDQRADVGLLQALERELAGALGASSARMVLTSVLRGAGLKLAEIVALFDEATQKLRINRELLEAMMDNMPQGISVVNAEMKLVAWNQRYLDLFDYPPGFVYVGRPVAELIRYNACRGWCGPGEPERHVARRLEYMRAGSTHISERQRPDGRVIEVRGQPLHDGGFVMTFSDVTSYKQVEQELRLINETLEQRVEERTHQLAKATAIAEQANLSKTRFVAAASHDLLQPLNAARLFNAALQDKVSQDVELKRLAERVDNSLCAADELLDALLDISRLDAGGIRPDITEFPVLPLLESLHEQYAPIAVQRGIRLKVKQTKLSVRCDHRMLRRVLQNFLSNALRYTRTGHIVVGCRRRAHGSEVELQVHDTGPGIPAEGLRLVFDEFQRLDRQSPWGEKGLGLGLSICDRISRLLGARLTVRSTPARGSAFGICVPRVAAALPKPAREPHALEPRAGFGTLRAVQVLCIEDDVDILDGLRELLGRWEMRVIGVENAEQAHEAIRHYRIDLVLADYHLHGQPIGLDLLVQLTDRISAGGPARGALITADASVTLLHEARARGFQLLRKPVRPAALRALLAALMHSAPEATRVNAHSSAGEPAA
jgi:Na+/proline symporter/signal transduction histidine kinase